MKTPFRSAMKTTTVSRINNKKQVAAGRIERRHKLGCQKLRGAKSKGDANERYKR